MNHYVYYSYESWGRGYIGSRSCECLPEEDYSYMGSYKDESFRPNQKIILFVEPTREEATNVEIFLHDLFEVDVNPHFANIVRQRSDGFHRSGPHLEKTILKMRRNRKGKGKGPSSLPKEFFQEIGKMGGAIGAQRQSRLDKKKGGDKCKEDKLGFFGLPEEENRRKSQKAAETTNQQTWKCLVTGKESTAGGLARWQKARGIDTSLRTRVYQEGEGV